MPVSRIVAACTLADDFSSDRPIETQSGRSRCEIQRSSGKISRITNVIRSRLVTAHARIDRSLRVSRDNLPAIKAVSLLALYLCRVAELLRFDRA